MGENDEVDDGNIDHIYRTEIQRQSQILVTAGRMVEMELDTGASLTMAGRRELE